MDRIEDEWAGNLLDEITALRAEVKEMRDGVAAIYAAVQPIVTAISSHPMMRTFFKGL